MATSNVQLTIPFKSLLNAIKKLSKEEKMRLWENLEEEITQYEEELIEKDTRIRQQIADAREAYKTGNYHTIDDYIKKREQQKN